MLGGLAVYFFGAPFATVILVPAVEPIVLMAAQYWYRKRGSHP